jgi:hypothetical protein
VPKRSLTFARGSAYVGAGFSSLILIFFRRPGLMLQIVGPLFYGVAVALWAPPPHPEFTAPPGVQSVQASIVVLARSGSRIRLEPRPWVSGSVVRFSDGLVIRVTEVTPALVGGVILEGDASPGDTLTVRSLTSEVAQLRVGGRLPATVRAEIVRLGAHLPVTFEEDVAGSAPDLVFQLDGDRLEVLSRDGGLRDVVVLREAPEEAVGAILTREIGARQLAMLANPLQPFDVRITVLVDGAGSGAAGTAVPTVPVGSEIGFRVASDRDGYLTLINLSPDGSVAVLSPTPEGYVHVRAGDWVVIPQPGSDLAYRVGYPTGVGLIRAVVTAEPLPIHAGRDGLRFPAVEDWGAHLQDALGVVVRGNRVEMDVSRTGGGWSSALVLYSVFDPF